MVGASSRRTLFRREVSEPLARNKHAIRIKSLRWEWCREPDVRRKPGRDEEESEGRVRETEETVMSSQNRYCCRCRRTTRFEVKDATFTCTGCGVQISTDEKTQERALIGDPFRSFKTSFAA
jgi:hypothetical protein